MSGLRDFTDRLVGFDRALDAELRAAGARLAVTALELARQNVRRQFRARSGRLEQSIRSTSRLAGGALTITLATDDPKAPAHEYGATIHAKNDFHDVPGGPYLAIPVGRQGRSAFGQLVLVKGKNGWALARPGAKGRLTIAFILRKQVKIPKRPFLRPALGTLRSRYLRDELHRATERAATRSR